MDSLNKNTIWALMPEFDLVSFFGQDKEALTKEASSGSSYSKSDKVAILPLYGMIVQKESWITKYGLGTSTETFSRWLDMALSDNSIGRIIIDVNSPGGSVYGVQELSDKIRNSRGKKPIVAIANTLMASAGYWVASAADKIYASPSADVGSVGVYMTHADFSEQLEKEGVKVTFISAGKYKVEGNAYEPLQEEAKAYLQKSVDDTYESFISSVAKNRNTTKSDVIANYGQGRVLSSKDAMKNGLIDGVKTLEEVLNIKRINTFSKKKAEMDIELRKLK